MEQDVKERAGSPKEHNDSKLEDDNKDNSSSDDSELDVTSEHFNALKALYAPDYRVTKKQPKIIYQNMAAFENALKKVGISGLNKKPPNTQPSGSKDAKNKNILVKEAKTQRRFQHHQLPIKTQTRVKSKHQRNILMQMAQSEGPLKKLHDYITEGRSIKVVIRREHGIKGHVEGVLKMFDRHWNLLMIDVVESLEHRKHKYAEDKLVTHQQPQDCSDLLSKLRITLPKETVKSLGRKRVLITRHLPQILLRGEHIVLISAK